MQQPPIEKLNWRLLGPGEVTLEQIIRHLGRFRHNHSNLTIDTTRITFILAQGPEKVFVGLDEFDGYFAFIFERVAKAVMESPIEGNAIYVFGNNWKQLSRLKKTDILHSQSNYERVVHTGDWQHRLLGCLT